MHYLPGAICVKENNIFTMYYTYTDNLGSITTIADQAGQIVQQNRFGAWGEAVDINGNTTAMQTTITDRGYTGHEHLAEFLISRKWQFLK